MNFKTRTLPEAFSMSFQERQAAKILIVEPSSELRQVIRSTTQSLGYGFGYCIGEHSAALLKLEDECYSHMFYSARSGACDVLAFLETAVELQSSLVSIAITENPEVDEIFRHLQKGARGFITKPVTTEMIDHSILQATLAQPFSQTILQAGDRNEAFSAFVAASLDRAVVAYRQSLKSSKAKLDVERYLFDLEAAVNLARTFCKNGEEALLASMVNFFIEIAEGPATRLGNLRKRLSEERKGVAAADQ